jgi:hypothetical protein
MRAKANVDSRMVCESPDAMTPSSLVAGLPKWEYQSVLGPRLLDLSKFGEQGWELTSVIPQPADQAIFYFRRSK